MGDEYENKGKYDKYPLIENHGFIGNMLTSALISIHAEINFMCWPHFDSPAVFCSLLDADKGGYWRITPSSCSKSDPKTCQQIKTKQSYWPDTNVLQTRFHLVESVVSIVDYMPIVDGKGLKWLVRKVKGIRGKMDMKMTFKPTFNFVRDKHSIKKTQCGGSGGNGYTISSKCTDVGSGVCSDMVNLDLISTLNTIEIIDNEHGGMLETNFTIHENEVVVFILKESNDVLGELFPKQLYSLPKDTGKMENELFMATIFYWQKWLEKCTYKGRWREIVERSALALKLMTFAPTGAIIAAPTCSLPEGIGGERNWDYRYAWLRDSSFSVYGLIRIGFTEEAHNFMKWLEERCEKAVYDDPTRMPLRIMYSIHGDERIPERTLDHLSGYKNSKPVRIGNDAVNQVQMDIFGEFMDSIYLSNKYGTLVSYDFWTHIRKMVDWVADHGHTMKDEGIWEVRSGKQHFTYSKIMCWVALDRGLRLADRRSFPAPREKWTVIRDKIYEEIQEFGYNKEMQTFTQYYGSKTLDASTLIMSLVFFMAPSDPRNINTINAILKPVEEGGLVANSLVFRYNLNHAEDGLDGEEGTFNICSFFCVEALTRLGSTSKENHDYLVKARLMFEEMLGYANHLGLYSEQIGLSGEALGNSPQAFSALSLISAAYNLDKALNGKATNV